MSNWTWSYDGGEERASVVFPTRAEAEAWLGESWQELADAGVRAVTLRVDEEPVYGPMSLEP
ncbi:hypothetical protein [Calidifontibacter terrae]